MTELEPKPDPGSDPTEGFDTFIADLPGQLRALFEAVCAQKAMLSKQDPRHSDMSMIEIGLSGALGHAEVLAQANANKPETPAPASPEPKITNPWADVSFTEPETGWHS
jgi:hypothetical protein